MKPSVKMWSLVEQQFPGPELQGCLDLCPLCGHQNHLSVPQTSEVVFKRRCPGCTLGVSEAISAAELLREASAPAVSAGGGGDALVNR
ncbi:hypothetical protein Q8A67_023986 [Cirrhinus molitorella]|uniref:Uncharacterized protein n=1 Tax=Cirrhinus molitorella TaxID=172907 RepID=A0AA88P4F5_9TELE|nr:hypothetical protein Q8A67_023986 [Cirrhinus molitorella]